ncbi:MAG: hypothetical protein ACFFCO_05955 [Promethearchaeota archaeon]
MSRKLLPDQMSIKSICLDCKHYQRKQGTCGATNPFAKEGDKHYLLLSDKSACFGFSQTRKKT